MVMRRRTIPATLACLAVALMASRAAGAVVTAGMHTLLPNAADQTISIVVGGGEPVGGVDLFVQIGDGGAAAGGDDAGPLITAVDFGGAGLFAGNNTGVFHDPTPLLWGATTTTQTGTVAAAGQLAMLTVSTVGITAGRYDLILDPPATGPTVFPGAATTLVNGWIQIGAPRPGDFNGDGAVDGADLAVWQENYGTTDATKPPPGDADGDQDVDGNDFLVWQQGLTPGGASVGATRAVPEPGELGAGLLIALAWRRRAARRPR
jgi:hypothetical protein